jgi:hypothetical protein
VLWPRTSTSGGQSGGGVGAVVVVVVFFLVRAAQEAKEVQVRQLWVVFVSMRLCCRRNVRFAVGA